MYAIMSAMCIVEWKRDRPTNIRTDGRDVASYRYVLLRLSSIKKKVFTRYFCIPIKLKEKEKKRDSKNIWNERKIQNEEKENWLNLKYS